MIWESGEPRWEPKVSVRVRWPRERVYREREPEVCLGLGNPCLAGQRRQPAKAIERSWGRSRGQMRMCAWEDRSREHFKEGEVGKVKCCREVGLDGEWQNAHQIKKHVGHW